VGLKVYYYYCYYCFCYYYCCHNLKYFCYD